MRILSETSADDAPPVAVLHLERPSGNAINDAFLESADEALEQVLASNARGLVITGKGSTFCSGLDLVTTLDYDRARMVAFVDAFEAFFKRVFSLPLPTVAAINGHAIAGGCILAMACDARVMGDRGTIGITEVALGIPFPASAFEIARFATRNDAYVDVFLEGRRLSPGDATMLGVIHELAGSDDVLSRAVARAKRLAMAPPGAYRQVKLDLRSEHLARIERDHVMRREAFLDAWFSEEGTAHRKHVADSLAAKKKGD